jgi:hypothetical protein
MASLKYRCLMEPDDLNIVTLPVAASQYFNNTGASWVYLDSSGNVTLALSATATLYGWAIVPTGQGAGTSNSYWKSSATAGADTIQVIPVNTALRFLVPNAGTAVAQSDLGNTCDMVAVNDGTVQSANVGTSSTKVFIVDGLGTDVAGGTTGDVIVKVNPAKIQAD